MNDTQASSWEDIPQVCRRPTVKGKKKGGVSDTKSNEDRAYHEQTTKAPPTTRTILRTDQLGTIVLTEPKIHLYCMCN